MTTFEMRNPEEIHPLARHFNKIAMLLSSAMFLTARSQDLVVADAAKNQ